MLLFPHIFLKGAENMYNVMTSCTIGIVLKFGLIECVHLFVASTF